MASLIHIGFDNSARLWKNVFYLEYKGIRFKLIQNNIRKWCDVLLTILKDSNNIELENKAYLTASEFLSALSWENNSIVKVWYMGKFSRPIDFRLREMKCGMRDFPKTPFYGYNVNNDLSRIPEIENEEQRDALTLFRDASSTNNDYLSFLFFWQIMEIRKNDPRGWINKTYRKNRNKIRLPEDIYERIQTNGKKLGNYFYDDCRNAIAHIFKRQRGKRKLKIDTPNDNLRITISTWIIKEFARFYIKDTLKVQKHMYLVRKNEKSFPIYVQEKYLREHPCKMAYKDHFRQYMLKKSY